MGIIDKALAFVGIPTANALAIDESNTKRDAARQDLSEFSGWNQRVRFPGVQRGFGWETILGRARDLDENNGWINGGLDRRVEAVIGVNIRLSAHPKHELLGRDYEWRMKWTADTQARFDVWGNDIERRCDARQILPFGAIAKLAYLQYVRDGIATAEIRDSRRGLRNPTNVMLFEPERIETPPEMSHMEGAELRDGVRYDRNGAPIGAYVRNRHPNDPAPDWSREKFSYIPVRSRTGRARLLRVFSPRRAEQTNGISRLAEIMVPAKMLDRVDRAEVQAALKSAIFSMFVKSPGTTDDLESALAPATEDATVDPWVEAYLERRSQQPIQVDGAQVVHLLPEEDIEVPQASHPNSNYPDFARFILQKVSGSLGISYPQLSQDWAGINYSSARALLNELWRSFLEDRFYFTQQFLTPIYAAWLEWEVANGDIKVPGGPANFYRRKTEICMAEWIGPGRGSVDPLKESSALNLDVAAGRMSPLEAIHERGRDPMDVIAETRWWINEREKQNLPDPDYNTKGSGDGGDASNSAATQEDRDGDGIAREDQKRKQKQED